MSGAAGSRHGYTALNRLTRTSRNGPATLEGHRQHLETTTPCRQCLSTTATTTSFLKLAILLICIFSQYGMSLALVGRSRTFWSRSASLPSGLTIDETPTVDFGHDLRANPMDLKRRQAVVADTSSASSSSFPKPFDGGVGNNFTASSCPLFFQNFMSDPDFQQCHAISLLLVTSQAFFQSSRSASTINTLLDTSCSANVQSCKGIMDNYAAGIKATGACGADFEAQNPNVLEAYQGFLAYEAVYSATCLKSTTSNGYCFTNAITNVSSPTSSYVYYLPLGIGLPASTQPTCNQCLETTMNNYAQYAGNGTLPLSAVYGQAVQTMDLVCGPKFVQATVPKVVGAAGRMHLPSLLLTTLSLVTVALLT